MGDWRLDWGESKRESFSTLKNGGRLAVGAGWIEGVGVSRGTEGEGGVGTRFGIGGFIRGVIVEMSAEE